MQAERQRGQRECFVMKQTNDYGSRSHAIVAFFVTHFELLFELLLPQGADAGNIRQLFLEVVDLFSEQLTVGTATRHGLPAWALAMWLVMGWWGTLASQPSCQRQSGLTDLGINCCLQLRCGGRRCLGAGATKWRCDVGGAFPGRFAPMYIGAFWSLGLISENLHTFTQTDCVHHIY